MKQIISNMKRILSIIVVLLVAVNVQAQKAVKLNITHVLDGKPLTLNSTTGKNDLNHQFNVSRLQYYISGITIVHDGGTRTEATDVYILADAGNQENLFDLGSYNVTTIESIEFHIGVDPSVNNDDPAKWESSHPLAPKVPSMHWGWSSGYRFVAMEGKGGTSLNAGYEMHALGNKNFFKQNIPYTGNEVNNEITINILADFGRALAGLDLETGFIEHSEDGAAITFLRYCQDEVFFNDNGDGNTMASVNDISVSNAFNVYPNPSKGAFKLAIDDVRFNNATVTVTNMLGETVLEISLDEPFKDINITAKGMYFITITKNGLKSTEKLIVM